MHVLVTKKRIQYRRQSVPYEKQLTIRTTKNRTPTEKSAVPTNRTLLATNYTVPTAKQMCLQQTVQKCQRSIQYRQQKGQQLINAYSTGSETYINNSKKYSTDTGV
jgi:Tfp pilus assembly PilM family ATPase